MLSLITTVQTFRPAWLPAARVRVMFWAVVLVGGVLVSLAASANFVSFFLNPIWALIGVLILWSVINLLDFYVVKY